jgi:hypothetical protein
MIARQPREGPRRRLSLGKRRLHCIPPGRRGFSEYTLGVMQTLARRERCMPSWRLGGQVRGQQVMGVHVGGGRAQSPTGCDRPSRALRATDYGQRTISMNRWLINSSRDFPGTTVTSPLACICWAVMPHERDSSRISRTFTSVVILFRVVPVEPVTGSQH